MKRDTSRDDMTYAVRLANRDYQVGDIARALSAKPSGRRQPGSVKYQRIFDTKGKDAADAYAQRTAAAAIDFVRRSPMIRDRNEALIRLLEIEAAAVALPWGVYAGPDVRRALEAVFVVADRVGSIRIGLSLREWAEVAGQGFEAVRKHRDALAELGWLRRDPDDKLGRTGRYTVRRPRHIQPTRGMNVGTAADRTWLAHDAFRPAALGDLGWYLLTATSSAGSPAELAVRTGLSDEVLADRLAVLERNDLISLRANGDVQSATDILPALNALAQSCGSAGAGNRMHERFEQDRVAWHSREAVNVANGVKP